MCLSVSLSAVYHFIYFYLSAFLCLAGWLAQNLEKKLTKVAKYIGATLVLKSVVIVREFVSYRWPLSRLV